MAFNWEALIFYVLLADSIIANLMACSPRAVKWYKKVARQKYNWFPLSKGWALLYLVLVLWIGWTLYRLGILWW